MHQKGADTWGGLFFEAPRGAGTWAPRPM
jgi:hypothetical protein